MDWKGGNEEKEVFGIGLAGRGDGFRELRERRTFQNDGIDVSWKEHVVANDGLGVECEPWFYGSKGYIVVFCYVFLPGNLAYSVFDFTGIGHDKCANAHSDTLYR